MLESEEGEVGTLLGVGKGRPSIEQERREYVKDWPGFSPYGWHVD